MQNDDIKLPWCVREQTLAVVVSMKIQVKNSTHFLNNMTLLYACSNTSLKCLV